jgi:hypothetical protein
MNINSRFTTINEAEPACERTCAKLLIYSPVLDSRAITSILGGLEPTSDVSARKSNGRYPGRANGWFLSSEGTVLSKDLRTHLDWLLKTVWPVKSALIGLQEREGTKMYVHCPWWAHFGTGGPSLWPEQMKLLSDLNLECAIDFADYSDPEHTDNL